ncbi:DUF4012 domain-containing protein [Microbacterium sp. ASV81]|uniref:DUF4012 domain-containing protein n=1 Tax=Microbacterium capsulatum TaxID=3041921 RepID=A0ABU0XHU5_9MICO|nr:DUF4012 domain-containing protein [Microbacterium sp. ASV81]
MAAIIGKHVYDNAMSARTHLTAAMTDVQLVQKAILVGDLDAGAKGADAASQQAAAAVSVTRDWQWSFCEKLPMVGQNLVAVRIVAQVTDGLVTDVVKPAASVKLSDFAFVDGGINVAAITNLSKTFAAGDSGIEKALAGLKKVDRSALVGPVADGVAKLETALKKVGPTMSTAREVLSVLPDALGANGAKDYVLMFQGNSEARSLGGNAAQFLPVHVENGKIVRGTVVSSTDFKGMPRSKPVASLDPQAVNIYGDKIGRFSADFTMVPNFPTAVQILHGWWASDIHTRFQGVLSIDPVALSYILDATGPVTLATGDQLTSQNAVPLLLNEVYFRYPEFKDQDRFFASAADSIFTKVTSGDMSPVKLIQALFRAAAEGRLLYQSDDPNQTKLVDSSRMSGMMPTGNTDQTVVGVYVNDNTGSKKSYYLNMGINVCRADGAVKGQSVLTSTLTQNEASRLPPYITGPYFAAEDISSYIVVYGPVGSQLASLTLDGKPVSPRSQGEHLGRPAVKLEVFSHLNDVHTIDFSFKTAKTEGPLAVWTTPMSRATPIKIEPACK